MNNERYDQIIDEVYSIFLSEATSIKEGYECGDILGSQRHIEEMFSNPDKLIILTQEEFIDKCKVDSRFAEEWGLKIEERELSLDERHSIALPTWKEKYGALAEMMVKTNVDNTPYNIPTKLITLNNTIQFYE